MPDLQISAADERFLSSSVEEAAKPETAVVTESPAAATTETPNEEPTGAEKPGEESKKAETVDDLPPWQKALISKEKNARLEAVRERDEAREQARKALDVAARLAPTKPASEAPKEPTPEQFDSQEAFDEARIKWRVERGVEATLAAKAQQDEQVRVETEWRSAQQQFDAQEAAAAEKYPDYIDVTRRKVALNIQPFVQQAIVTSSVGAEISYLLLKDDAKELRRIEALSPAAAVREIGRIEAKLVEAPKPAPEVSKAPKPTTTVSGSKTTVKASSDLSIAEIDAADKAERRKRAGLSASP